MNRSALQATGPGLGADQRAFELAYRFFSRRDRTISEVRIHLSRHDIDEVSATAVIEELVEQGYLDDVRFARLFVQDKRALEQWGGERIKRALLGRGIDRELADAALASDDRSGEESGELDRALQLLRQRFRAPPRARRERERALGLLMRKGYDSELALEAINVHGRDEA